MPNSLASGWTLSSPSGINGGAGRRPCSLPRGVLHLQTVQVVGDVSRHLGNNGEAAYYFLRFGIGVTLLIALARNCSSRASYLLVNSARVC